MKKWYADGVAIPYLAIFAYCSFPLGWRTFVYFGFGIVILLRRIGLNQWNMKKAWLFSGVGTALGVLVRYLAEYGGNGWNQNFTAEHVVQYLIAVPIYTVWVYNVLNWYVRRKDP